MGIKSVAVLGLMGHGSMRRWELNPQLVAVSPAPGALVELFPCVTPAGNGASDHSGLVSRKGGRKLGVWLGLVCESVQFGKS